MSKPPKKSVLGKYTVDQRLGSGTYGSVWRGTPDGRKPFYALKRFDIANQNDNEDKFVSFLTELAIISYVCSKLLKYDPKYPIGCDKESFVIIDSYQIIDSLVYKPELTDGVIVYEQYTQSLYEFRITNPDIKVQKLAEIISKLAYILGFLHENQIAHNDVKSTNIMMTSRGDPKLIDFGLACMNERLWKDIACEQLKNITKELMDNISLTGDEELNMPALQEILQLEIEATVGNDKFKDLKCYVIKTPYRYHMLSQLRYGLFNIANNTINNVPNTTKLNNYYDKLNYTIEQGVLDYGFLSGIGNDCFGLAVTFMEILINDDKKFFSYPYQNIDIVPKIFDEATRKYPQFSICLRKILYQMLGMVPKAEDSNQYKYPYVTAQVDNKVVLILKYVPNMKLFGDELCAFARDANADCELQTPPTDDDYDDDKDMKRRKLVKNDIV